MSKGRVKYLPIPALFIDAILLFNAFLTAAYFVFDGKFPDALFYYQIFFGWLLLWIVIVINLKLYDLPRILYIDKIVAKNMKAIIIFALVSAALIYLITDHMFSKLFFGLVITLFSIMQIFWHSMLVVLFKAYRRNGHNFKTIAIVGFNDQVDKYINEVLLVPEYGYVISGVFGTTELPEKLLEFYKGTEEELLLFLERYLIIPQN